MSRTSNQSTEAFASEVALSAKMSFRNSQMLPVSARVAALHRIKENLEADKAEILAANKQDMEAAQSEVDAGRMSASMLKRLDLSKGDKWASMVQGVSEIAALPDPLNAVLHASELDDGLELYRVSCPIGVLLVIFEARPEVVVNIAALAIKSGNAAILKGGKESMRTTKRLYDAISHSLRESMSMWLLIQIVETREEVSALLQMDAWIDLVIPRGSNSLVKEIQSKTRIPVMGHADGICTVYLDEKASLEKSLRVTLDSKTNYPAACNAAEILIVHQALLSTIWPEVAKALLSANVRLICDNLSFEAIANLSPLPQNFSTHVSSPDDSDTYMTEHLDLTLSVKVIPSFGEAVEFINNSSSHHTDCIVTESDNAASAFCRSVDSAGTFVNASTRFADGYRYGFGAEVGISTGRIHARGPVGLEGLTTYKYMLRSKDTKGHIVGEFGEGKRQFKHARIDTNVPPF